MSRRQTTYADVAGGTTVVSGPGAHASASAPASGHGSGQGAETGRRRVPGRHRHCAQCWTDGGSLSEGRPDSWIGIVITARRMSVADAVCSPACLLAFVQRQAEALP